MALTHTSAAIITTIVLLLALLLASLYLQGELTVFHLSLSDSKSYQISKTLRSILAYFKTARLSSRLSRFFIWYPVHPVAFSRNCPKSFNHDWNHLRLDNFFGSLEMSRYLYSFFFFSRLLLFSFYGLREWQNPLYVKCFSITKTRSLPSGLEL